MTQNSCLGYVPSGYNYIINPCFEVNQRGVASQSTNSAIVVDQWKMQFGGTTAALTAAQGTFTIGQTDVPGEPINFIQCDVTAGTVDSSYVDLTYAIENVRTFAGQTATMSFWAKANATKSLSINFAQGFGTGGSSSVTIAGQKVTLSTTWTKYIITFNFPSISGKTIGASNHIRFYMWFDAGANYNTETNSLGHQSGTFYIANVKLEAGTVATPFVVPTYAEELRKCQRYFRPVGNRTNTYEYITSTGICASTTLAIIPIMLNPPMRATPSIIAPTAYTNFRLFDGATGTTLSANPAINNSSPACVNIECTVASGLTQYRPVTLTALNQTNDYIGLSAEL